ncbi:MAG: TIR domain-containing protein [Steroidobacteraceae bacterium]
MKDRFEAEPRKLRIFLSYAHVDRPRIATIATALEAEGFEVWWDTLIEGGSAFTKAIAAALDASAAVIVIWSIASIESDWVLDEAMHARDQKKLIPVTLDGIQSPLGFRQYQAIDLSAWSGDRASPLWSSVLRALAALAAGPARAQTKYSASAPPVHGSPTLFSRRGFLGAGATAALAGGGYFLWRRSRPDVASAHSVAVLPFQNLSGDSSQAFFSDGLAEEMRLALSRDGQLQVAAQTSSNVFRERREDATTIASKLHVAYLVDGSVRRSAEMVRIGIALIDAATGFNRWSHTFDRTLNDIFALQSEIANTVVQRISAQLSALRSIAGGTTNLAAFDAYWHGVELYRADAGEPSDREALAAFETAIAADPNYAAAHAARSNSLTLIAQQYAAANALAGLYAEAETEARRAISLASELPAPYIALGNLEFSGRLNVRAARDPYERAYRLGAGDASVLSAVAFYYAQTGLAREAAAAIARALILDPLNANAYRSAGWVAYAARHYADAIPSLQHALALNPKIVNAHASIGDANLLLGRLREARESYAAEPGDPFRFTGLAIAERRLGNDAAAAAANDQLVSKIGDSALYQQAQVKAQWGDRELAVGLLLRARKIGDAGLLYMHTDPLLDSLRPDPRFRRLEQDLGFG